MVDFFVVANDVVDSVVDAKTNRTDFYESIRTDDNPSAINIFDIIHRSYGTSSVPYQDTDF